MVKKQIYGCGKVNPLTAGREFGQIVDGAIAQFISQSDEKITFKIEIEVEDEKDFDENLQQGTR
ncbi:hypothetical protein RJ40_07675 [Methanofollis aquaemaris]|uniref:Uncharacterized protein n=1 Tax=Methanofollis aquaemaris TaxID=126734 RepID=A0A8A3S692_9EURY|nr:hypothetical protein [Methanofollis aquaemaris]QSZ67389.1 hypothetical protein RJ40_07675 [Methanofollis aquaemaris]